MIWGLISAAGMAALFLWLWVRGAVANGRLRAENSELAKNVDIKQKQLEIAANHPDTPASLADRMHNGTL